MPITKAYTAINETVLGVVSDQVTSLLDVGCGSGALSGEIKRRIAPDCNITGLTHSSTEASLARDCLDDVVICDLNTYDFSQLGKFDCIICSHVLEHLSDPISVLRRLRNNLLPSGYLIVALPNAMHWKQRVQFAMGRFRYTEFGTMDRTHLRFFDWNTALNLVREAGFVRLKRTADGSFPMPFVRKCFGPIAKLADGAALRWFPNVFGWQFIIVARTV